MPLWLSILLYVLLFLAVGGAVREIEQLKDKIKNQEEEIDALKRTMLTHQYDDFSNIGGY